MYMKRGRRAASACLLQVAILFHDQVCAENCLVLGSGRVGGVKVFQAAGISVKLHRMPHVTRAHKLHWFAVCSTLRPDNLLQQSRMASLLHT